MAKLKLKAMRLKRNMTQCELAKRMRKSTQCVSKQERYGIRSVIILRKYAAVLECRASDLIDCGDEP